MSTRTRYVAEYLYPGLLFPETTSRDIEAPTLAAAVAAAPAEDGYFRKDGWFAVRIKTIAEKEYISDDGESKWIRDGDPQVQRVIVGRLVHHEAPELEGDDFSILRSNIRVNSRAPFEGYGVLARCGNWQIASDYDQVVGPEAVAS